MVSSLLELTLVHCWAPVSLGRPGSQYGDAYRVGLFEAFMQGLLSEGPEASRDLIRLGYLTAICGYGVGAVAVPAMIDARIGPWEWVLERYGEQDALENLPTSYRI